MFANGKRIARRDSVSGLVYYYFTDNLGSSSVVTNSSGAIQNESDYYPYGGERGYAQSLANQNYKYTGKERDPESGLDNFGARYDSSNLGRFMTPDWDARPTTVPYAVFGDPQSLNLYGYVRNDPVSQVDADGHGWLQDWLGLGANEPKVGPPTCTSGRQDKAAAQSEVRSGLQTVINDVDTVTKPVQPLATELQKLPDLDVNVSLTAAGNTVSTDGSHSLTPALVGASVDGSVTLVKNPSQEIGDLEVGLSKHTAVNGSLVLDSEGKPRVGKVGASVGAAWPETGRVSGSLSAGFVQRTFETGVTKLITIVEGAQRALHPFD